MHGVGQDNRLHALLCSLLNIVDDRVNWERDVLQGCILGPLCLLLVINF